MCELAASNGCLALFVAHDSTNIANRTPHKHDREGNREKQKENAKKHVSCCG
jgi:hypothetical protein